LALAGAGIGTRDQFFETLFLRLAIGLALVAYIFGIF
jgi:hypothetical protein